MYPAFGGTENWWQNNPSGSQQGYGSTNPSGFSGAQSGSFGGPYGYNPSMWFGTYTPGFQGYHPGYGMGMQHWGWGGQGWHPGFGMQGSFPWQGYQGHMPYSFANYPYNWFGTYTPGFQGFNPGFGMGMGMPSWGGQSFGMQGSFPWHGYQGQMPYNWYGTYTPGFQGYHPGYGMGMQHWGWGGQGWHPGFGTQGSFPWQGYQGHMPYSFANYPYDWYGTYTPGFQSFNPGFGMGMGMPGMHNWGSQGFGMQGSFPWQGYQGSYPGFGGSMGLGGLRHWGGTYTPQFTTTGLPTDDEIAEMIYDTLDADPLVPWDADIDVNVDAGTVNLSGTVPNKRIKHAAGDDAWWIPGVTDVQNSLQVSGRHRGRTGESGQTGSQAGGGQARRRTTGTQSQPQSQG
jgi:hypothetical protein